MNGRQCKTRLYNIHFHAMKWQFLLTDTKRVQRFIAVIIVFVLVDIVECPRCEVSIELCVSRKSEPLRPSSCSQCVTYTHKSRRCHFPFYSQPLHEIILGYKLEKLNLNENYFRK